LKRAADKWAVNVSFLSSCDNSLADKRAVDVSSFEEGSCEKRVVDKREAELKTVDKMEVE
jgi:hypothetical protein